MNREDPRYRVYLDILKEELVPAMGCTEPIALAYAAAKARDVLGAVPEKVLASVSGSIIKNVKSVYVPNTGQMKGMEAAIAAGIVFGKAEKELEVLSGAGGDDTGPEIRAFLKRVPVGIRHIENGHYFEIQITEYAGEDQATIRIVDYHTNIVLLKKNGTVLIEAQETETGEPMADRGVLSMEGIWDFAMTADIRDVKALLDRQILYNTAISDEGLIGDYGANIGSVLLNSADGDIRIIARAKAAAGSDARMNGCDLPVVINSGSGNQGITCSVPVIEYAKHLHSGKEKLYRALLLSNLTTIHEKTGIGTLSAFCGAVSAGAGAGAGIAYLCGGDYDVVKHTVVNALAITSGIVCDGAKASCAAKIASAIDAGILGYEMYRNGQQFRSGDGIVMKDIESTIRGIGRLGRDGMRETNEEIIRLMLQN